MNNYPAVKAAVLFVTGILSSHFFTVDIILILIFFAAAILLFLFQNKFKSNPYFPIVAFLAAGLLVFSTGNYWANQNKTSYDPLLIEIDRVKNTTAFGEIKQIDLLRNDQLNFYLAVDSLYSEEFFIREKINILCKVRTGNKTIPELYKELKPGYIVEVNGLYNRGKQMRNPGEYDYDAYLKSKDILGIISVNNISSVNVISYEANVFMDIVHQVRKAIDDQFKKYHSPETASLLRGLLLADRGEINYQTKAQFINAGVVHVLAVSGLHVGFIVLIFLFLFGRFNLFLRSTLTIVGLLCFMLITGVPPSVFRATVMAIVLIIAFISNRSTNLINSISIAALIILIINPGEIYHPGFQLSFSAVLSIAIILPYLNRAVIGWNIQNKILRHIILFGCVSLSAQIGTLPFTLLYFNKFSVVALLTNLFVIPAIGFIIAAAVVTLFFSAVLPFAAIYFAAANDLFTGFILKLIRFSGDLSFSHISVVNYSLYDLIIFYAMLGLLLYYLSKFTTMRPKIILFVLIGFNTILFSSLDDSGLLPDNYLSVLMIDVGQGDSFLIKFPNSQTALVDAGNTTSTFDTGERVIIPLLNYLGIKKIDYGIVSHIDADHYGGFVALILDNKIGEIFKPEIDSSLSKDKRFEDFLRERGVPVKYFREEKLGIGNTALYFLYDENIKSISGLSTNDRSGIFKLVYGKTSFLFTGDVEKKVESFYAGKYRHFLDSDVLKAGHHGSKTSSSDEFLKYVTPEYSLISAGFKNKFGHPAEAVIQRLEGYGSKIYRSDLHKAVLLRSDGEEIKYINW
jgi:competence protein ComEC